MKTHRNDLPDMVGKYVKVPGERYGVCRIGYFNDSPDAGHFEVEFISGPPELFLWDEVKPVETADLPEGVTVPDRNTNYPKPWYGSGGVFHSDGVRDDRYSVGLEYCGYPEAYVGRFCGREFISAETSESQAWRAARAHTKARMGGVTA